jgi:hypothetical protein
MLKEKTAAEPEIFDGGADIVPFNESFPGVPPLSVREKNVSRLPCGIAARWRGRVDERPLCE